MDLDTQAHKLVAGLVRVAVMAPADGSVEPPVDRLPVQRQAMLLLSRRDREYRLTDLAGDLGATVPATMAVLSPLIGAGLVEMRPAPSYASRDMRVAVTEKGLGETPAPANWASVALGTIETLDDVSQQRLLRRVTTEISELQQDGRIPVTHMCLSCRFFDGYRHAGTPEPHHCWFVDAPFGYRELRLHCPDHVPADRPQPAGEPNAS